MDERYVGSEAGIEKSKAGLYANDNKSSTVEQTVKKIGINELKAQWGLLLDTNEAKCLDEEWGVKNKITQ